jgi:ABC-2 type transport system permease protein
MTSPASFINYGILLNDLKRFWWIGAGYLLGLLSVPLTIMTVHSQMEQAIALSNYPIQSFVNNIQDVFRLTSPALQPVLLVLVPIAAGILLFQHLQDGRAADMIHVLPVKRSTLYHTHLLSGLLFLAAPPLLTALISWALIASFGLHQIGLLTILTWLGLALLFNLLFFLLSAATAMVTGMSIIQVVLSLVLLLLPSGLGMLLVVNARMYAYGFASNYYLEWVNGAISPLFQMLNVAAIQDGVVVAYLVVCIVLYLLGLYLYQMRRLETAGDAITFGVLRPVFKYSAAFCAMLLVGYYFARLQNGSVNWAYAGYFLGSLVAYFLSEAILNKSLAVFRRPTVQGYGAFALVVALLAVGLHFGVNGFEQRLPALNQVQSIYLDNAFPIQHENFALRSQELAQAQAPDEYTYLPLPQPVYKDAGSIDDIYALNQALIANRDREKASGLYQRNQQLLAMTPLCLVYNLKNGGCFVREYHVQLSDYARQVKPLYESREYKYLHNSVLSVDPADIVGLSINPEPTEPTGKGVHLAGREQLQRAVTALQSDILQQTYEEMTSERPEWASIDILVKNHRITGLSWEKSYVNFGRYLQTIGVYDDARIMPADLRYALVLQSTGSGGKLSANQPLLALENSPDCLKIADPQQTEDCMLQYTSFYQQPYQVVFVLKDGNIFGGCFTRADAPAFVRQYFARQ